MDTTQILYLVGAFVLGFVIAWFAGRGGPKRAAEEAAAETQSVRSKLRTVESDLQKTQGQQKENLASLDQLSAEKSNLVAMLKTSETSLTDAGVEIQRLTSALSDAQSDGLLLQTELSQARSALGEARTQVMALTAALDAAAEVVEEVEETAIVEHNVNDELAARMTELESELALARATADRLAEKQVLVSTELYLKRREYSDIIGAGDDAVVSALAARDQALFEAQTEMDYMRRDLSMLTAAGAQLADALQKRSEDYEGLMHRLVTSESAVRALPEVSLATAAATALVAEAAPETAARAEEAPAEEVAEEAGPDLAAELEARAAEARRTQERAREPESCAGYCHRRARRPEESARCTGNRHRRPNGQAGGGQRPGGFALFCERQIRGAIEGTLERHRRLAGQDRRFRRYAAQPAPRYRGRSSRKWR